MATIASLIVEFGAKDIGFGKFAGQVEKRLGSITKMSAVAGAAVAALGAAAFYGLKKAADAAGEADANLQSLANAMGRRGTPNAAAAAAAFGEYAGQLQKTSRFSDDAALKAAALGVRLGLPVNRLKEITQRAADFAQGSGQSLESTMFAIAKANNGMLRGLQQSGVKIDEAAFKARGLDAVLEGLDARFGGAALDSVQNYEGRLILLGNAWGEVVEAVGRAVTQSPMVNAMLVEAAKALDRLSEFIAANQKTMQGWIEKGIGLAFDAVRLLIRALGLAGKAFLAFKVAGNIAVGGVVQAFQYLAEANEWVVSGLAKLARLAKMDGLADSLQAVADDFGKFAKDLQDTADTFYSTANDAVEAWDPFSALIEDLDDRVLSFEQRLKKLGSTIKVTPLAAVAAVGGAGGAGGVGAPGIGAAMGGSMARGFLGLGGHLRSPTSADRLAGGAQIGAGILAGGISGTAGNVIAGAQAGAAGGPLGMAAGAIAALVSESKQFQAILGIVNKVLGRVADLLGVALEPLIPIIDMAVKAFVPLISALAPLLRVLSALNPQFILLNVTMRLLTPALKLLFDAIRAVGIGMLTLVQKALKAVGASSKSVSEALGELKDMTWESAGAIDEMGTAADAAAGALYNLPEGFKYALRRFQVMDPTGRGPSAGPTGTGTSGGSGTSGGTGSFNPPGTGAPGTAGQASGASAAGAPITIMGDLIVQGVTDLASLVRELKREQERGTIRVHGTVVPVGGGR